MFLKNKKIAVFLPLIFALPVFGSGCSINQNDGGVYKTFDEGSNWKQIIKIEENEKEDLANSDVLKMIIDPFTPHVAFLLTKDKGLFVSNTFGDSWKRVLPETSSVFDLAADPFQKGHLYVSVLLNGRGKLLESENGGIDWKEIYTEAGKGTHVSHLKVSKFTPGSLFAVNSEGLLIGSFDRGTTWRPIFPFNESVISFFEDPVSPNRFWAISQKGLWSSEQGGADFSLMELNPGVGYQFSLLQKENEKLFLQTENGLFQSSDNGKIWQKIITLNNPKEFPVNIILAFPGSKEKLAIGAGMTLYITENGGETFKAIQFDISKEISSILIKPDESNQILVGGRIINRNRIGFF